jgi:hypothetical protein
MQNYLSYRRVVIDESNAPLFILFFKNLLIKYQEVQVKNLNL